MVLLPVHDQNSLKFIPFQIVTAGLIAANVLVFLFQMTLDPSQWGAFAYTGGMLPISVLDSGFNEGAEIPLPPGWVYLPPSLTLLTHMFLHADFWHLLGNMLFLYVFGDNIEDAMGHVTFLAFYLVCGIAGGLAHALAEPQSQIPLIGASGAISGLIAGYLLLHPRVKIWTLLLMRIPIPLPAYAVLGLWLVTQVYFVAFHPGEPTGTAWWAHLGGFGAGLILTPLLKRSDVKLFG